MVDETSQSQQRLYQLEYYTRAVTLEHDSCRPAPVNDIWKDDLRSQFTQSSLSPRSPRGTNMTNKRQKKMLPQNYPKSPAYVQVYFNSFGKEYIDSLEGVMKQKNISSPRTYIPPLKQKRKQTKLNSPRDGSLEKKKMKFEEQEAVRNAKKLQDYLYRRQKVHDQNFSAGQKKNAVERNRAAQYRTEAIQRNDIEIEIPCHQPEISHLDGSQQD